MNDIWGPVDVRSWRDVPSITGRLATEIDVKDGRAAFYLQGDGTVAATPFDVTLPACVIVRAEGTSDEIRAIAIQAEKLSEEMVAIGYRFLSGGNGIATLLEVEFLPGPDARFVAETK